LALLPLFRSAVADETKEAEAESTVPTSQRIAELDGEIAAIDQQTSVAQAERKQLQDEAADLKLKLNFLEGRLSSLENTRQKHTQEIEELLKKSGDWISFSQQIASIFQNHCVTCHNARNPQGQYSMADYAAITSGGESGSPVVPGRAEESMLFQMIVDGSMPKDSPSLSSDQVELVRKWIDQGARLDAKVPPESPLFRLTPRIPHPPAPEQYPTALPVTSVAISPLGDLVATSGYHEVLLWSWPGGQLQKRLGNVAQRVYGLAFHPESQRLAVASGTPGRLGELKLFDTSSGELLADLWVNHDSVLCVTFSPDGRYLACGDTTGSLVVFDPENASNQVWHSQEHTDWIQSIAWSKDSRRMVTASRDKTCKIFDSQTGQLQNTWNGHQDAVVAALFSHDDKQIISAGQDAILRVWRADDGKEVHKADKWDERIAGFHLLEPPLLIVCSEGSQLGVFDIEKGRLITSHIVTTARNQCVAISSCRKKLALGSHGGQLSVIDLDTSGSPIDSATKIWLAQPGLASP
jgi:WD40 repeat protein